MERWLEILNSPLHQPLLPSSSNTPIRPAAGSRPSARRGCSALSTRCEAPTPSGRPSTRPPSSWPPTTPSHPRCGTLRPRRPELTASTGGEREGGLCACTREGGRGIKNCVGWWERVRLCLDLTHSSLLISAKLSPRPLASGSTSRRRHTTASWRTSSPTWRSMRSKSRPAR